MATDDKQPVNFTPLCPMFILLLHWARCLHFVKSWSPYSWMCVLKTLVSLLNVIVVQCCQACLTCIPLLCLHYIQWGRTPLDLARRNGYNAVVSLLEKGTHFSELLTFKENASSNARSVIITPIHFITPYPYTVWFTSCCADISCTPYKS